MEFRARHKWLRLSAQKARPVADVVRGMDAQEALDVLRFMPQKAARHLGKAVHSALANARAFEGEEKPDVDKLFLKTVFIDGGPTLKRIKYRAYGRANRMRRRTSHITVVLAPRLEGEAAPRRGRATRRPAAPGGPERPTAKGAEEAAAKPAKPKKPRFFGFKKKEKYGAKVKSDAGPKEKSKGEHRKTERGTKGRAKKK